ncbi:hypothetical protein PMAYCL1PPCAC_33019, partial [Pristionchus mayeri]
RSSLFGSCPSTCTGRSRAGSSCPASSDLPRQLPSSPTIRRIPGSCPVPDTRCSCPDRANLRSPVEERRGRARAGEAASSLLARLWPLISRQLSP